MLIIFILRIVTLAAESNGLKINVLKTKTVCINETSRDLIVIGAREEEDVCQFCYLESIISTNGGSGEDIDNRLEKAL